MKTLTVTQPGTTAWTATSDTPTVATVAQGTNAHKFVVKSVSSGDAEITIKDAIGNLFRVPVTVP